MAESPLGTPLLAHVKVQNYVAVKTAGKSGHPLSSSNASIFFSDSPVEGGGQLRTYSLPICLFYLKCQTLNVVLRKTLLPKSKKSLFTHL